MLFETFITVISGVLVFVFGQLFIELFLKPLRRYKELKAKLSYILVRYYWSITHVRTFTSFESERAGIPTTKSNEYENSEALECKNKLREIAAELEGFVTEKWRVVNFFFAKPSNISIVVKLLFDISGNMIIDKKKRDESNEFNRNAVDKISKRMKIMKKLDI